MNRFVLFFSKLWGSRGTLTSLVLATAFMTVLCSVLIFGFGALFFYIGIGETWFSDKAPTPEFLFGLTSLSAIVVFYCLIKALCAILNAVWRVWESTLEK